MKKLRRYDASENFNEYRIIDYNNPFIIDTLRKNKRREYRDLCDRDRFYTSHFLFSNIPKLSIVRFSFEKLNTQWLENNSRRIDLMCNFFGTGKIILQQDNRIFIIDVRDINEIPLFLLPNIKIMVVGNVFCDYYIYSYDTMTDYLSFFNYKKISKNLFAFNKRIYYRDELIEMNIL